MSQLAFFGYGIAGLGFLGLFVLLLTGWRARFQGSQLMWAVGGTAVWSIAAAFQAGYGTPGLDLVLAFEVVRNLLWIFFFLHLLKPFAAGNALYTKLLGYVRLGCLVLGLLMLAMLASMPDFLAGLRSPEMQREFSLVGQLLYAVLGMALVEQLFRNTPVEQRWGIKYLCFGLGALFVFDFYLYADALLFHRIDPAIWSARGFVMIMAIPLVGITAARNPDWSLMVFMSRRMVLHSTTLLSAGLYMLLMALAGYYIRLYGGEWGGVLQIAFLFGAIIVLVALLFSGQFRARTKVFLNKHFFSYRYDYREEWLRVIGLLAGERGELPLQERVIWALSEIVESSGGLIWIRGEKGSFRLRARFNCQHIVEARIDAEEPLLAFMASKRWVIDLDEYRADPEVYDDLNIPEWIIGNADSWLIVPLIHDDRLLGMVMLLQPRAPQSINWENLDLLKTVGLQAASYIAFNQAAEALAEARQFEGFNRLSAFVIHDLKNLIAQLSLVAKNAGRHRHNPEFIDDAVSTIENAVHKMNRLMAQLKSADITGESRRINLVDELRDVVDAKQGGSPSPTLQTDVETAMVVAEPDRLSSVLGHVVQNAQDATPPDGDVHLRLRLAGDQAIVEVRDTGSGMDADFIKTRLFRPFDSTKGLTGMGIGAYECREVISALGGQVVVESKPGAGTTFRILLPLADNARQVPPLAQAAAEGPIQP
ncbi:MAG: PEP-CTERM system histidine kinase PrsK [Gammaproteobacteria bacterium]|nr:PEP-CTERM system histidine kinase PrsK [Gammaproteobacteria bacterium]